MNLNLKELMDLVIDVYALRPREEVSEEVTGRAKRILGGEKYSREYLPTLLIQKYPDKKEVICEVLLRSYLRNWSVFRDSITYYHVSAEDVERFIATTV